jgi:energy-converting hydrogenase Eha subunit B
MTRRKLLASLVVVLVVIAGALGWMRFVTHDTPAGQPPLAALDASTLATLKADFNRAAGDTRLILLLSPT